MLVLQKVSEWPKFINENCCEYDMTLNSFHPMNKTFLVRIARQLRSKMVLFHVEMLFCYCIWATNSSFVYILHRIIITSVINGLK